jgi:flagellar hook-basal body complex protein FliE
MDKLSSIQSPLSFKNLGQVTKTESSSENSFQALFKDAINHVNSAQKESEKLTSQLVTGEVQDVHQVMIASQKASLSLDLTVQIRKRVIESYQEIMRMQM